MAMIHFYNHDYKTALGLIELTLGEFKQYKSENFNLTEYQQAVFIKLLGNYCALSLFMNRFDESKEASNEIIQTISQAKTAHKRGLHESVCYTFFRFKNFEMLKDGYFENLESKFSGETLGCLYLILGLNRELLNDNSLALIYYKRSLEVW
mmetsp:Transcript_28760/g.25885  ORF Transcript_28760/g.25885 Transcript_28760/m.25885 type:complete len:151 (-) Transcript_28760:609-1061(-)